MLSTYETNIIKYIFTFLNSATVEKDLKVKVNREDGQVYNRTKRFAHLVILEMRKWGYRYRRFYTNELIKMHKMYVFYTMKFIAFFSYTDIVLTHNMSNLVYIMISRSLPLNFIIQFNKTARRKSISYSILNELYIIGRY